MTRFSDDDLEKMLREPDITSPPEGLLEAIKKEIPEHTAPSARGRWSWLMASAVAASLLIGLAVLLLLPSEDPPSEAPSVAVLQDERVAAQDKDEPADDEPLKETASPPPTESEQVAVAAPRREQLTIQGVVRDETRAGLPGALVTLDRGALGTWQVTSTDDGSYRFSGMPEGRYRLRAEMSGFATVETQLAMVASSTAVVSEDLVLPLSGVAETLTVVGASPGVVTSYSASINYHKVAVGPSTGGTHEPNDAAYDRVFLESYGVNPFVDTEDDPLSTFAIDVDTGSYTIVRRYITDGHLPEPDAVRVEEMVNFFEYGDESPEKDDFAIHTELAESPFATTARTRLLRIGLQSRTVDPEERKPVVLTFLVDVSGSMAREDRLELVKQGLSLLLNGLKPEDRVGLVVFGSDARTLHAPTGDLAALKSAIDALASEGATNMEQGLTLAYEMAEEHFAEGANNRVVLCSDGVANVGGTAWDSLLERVDARASRGIELTALGFGMGNYNDVLMEQLADHGDGHYAYIDTLREARRVFVHQITSMLETVAKNAKIQVAFEPEHVSSYRLLGFENRDVADEDFRNDSVDAGEVGAGHAVTALYELKLEKERPRRGRLAVIRLRYERAEDGRVREADRVVDVRAMRPSWRAATPAFRLAAIVAEFSELLRGSYWAREGSFDDLFIEAQRLMPDFPGRTDAAELVDLIGKARDLRALEESSP